MWRARRDIKLDLRDVGPPWVRDRARVDFERVCWAEWATKTEQAPEVSVGVVPRVPAGYWLEPTRASFAAAAARAGRELTPFAPACLRSPMVGGQRSQAPV
ncbi:unnamed protein product [Prorocentrum cordatum]|uniref:Uncharacterized protein n=1 Tax=Prorocentrum cordatum TaxID=2364126 RepID=A0ABN9VTG9_9DINO|nr:unnamed protein product [Polarella glacialis]